MKKLHFIPAVVSLLLFFSTSSIRAQLLQLFEDPRLISSDVAANDAFGASVSVDGKMVVVGSPNNDDAGSNSGSAYYFDCSNSPCVEVSKLTASDAASTDAFGSSVAISGTTVIVGAYNKDYLGLNEVGSVYVFDCSNYSCTQVVKLIPSTPLAYEWFGRNNIDISGNNVIVGARGDHEGGSNSGAVFYYNLTNCNDPVCTETARLTASDAAVNDQFGTSLSISGNFAVVGAYLNDFIGNDSGGAYYFDLTSCETSCTETGRLVASDGGSNRNFGYSVSVDGTKALVGAHRDDVAGAYSSVGNSTGGAYYFDLTSCETSCTEISKLEASDAMAGDWFGYSVDLNISEKYALVSAPGDYYSWLGTGKVYYYYLDNCPTSCQETGQITSSITNPADAFGHSLSSSDDLTLVGAFGNDDYGYYAGSAFIFRDNLQPVSNAGVSQTVLVDTLVTLDGSSSSDPDLNSLTYFWIEDVGNPQTGILSGVDSINPTFLPKSAGTYNFTLYVHDGIVYSDPDSVTVTVQTPSGAIEDLVDVVYSYNLQNGINNSLDAKLDAALNALDDLNENNDQAAINSLQSFINAVEAQRGDKITNEQADILVAVAQEVINSLSS